VAAFLKARCLFEAQSSVVAPTVASAQGEERGRGRKAVPEATMEVFSCA
jgi:hypothetical protein